jgi:hypothetical protein
LIIPLWLLEAARSISGPLAHGTAQFCLNGSFSLLFPGLGADNAPMMHGFLIDLHLACRVVAFLLGVFGLYLTCFLFEGEEGRWQNRLETLWISIDDRARMTDSRFTAVVSRVAQVLVKGYNRMFGEHLISFQAVGVSISSSLAFAMLLSAIIDVSSAATLRGDLFLVIMLILACVFAILAILPSLRPNWVTTLLAWTPLIA